MGKPQKHNQISFFAILGPRPTLGTVASGNFVENLGFFIRIQGWTNNRESTRKYDIRGLSHFRTSVPFWEQQAPTYWTRRTGNTPENLCPTHTRSARVPINGLTDRVQNQ